MSLHFNERLSGRGPAYWIRYARGFLLVGGIWLWCKLWRAKVHCSYESEFPTTDDQRNHQDHRK